VIAARLRSLHRELSIHSRSSHRKNEEEEHMSEMRNEILAAWAIAAVLVVGLATLTLMPPGPRSAVVGAVDAAVHGFKVKIHELDHRGVGADFAPSEPIDVSGEEITAPMVLIEPMAHTESDFVQRNRRVVPWADHCLATDASRGVG